MRAFFITLLIVLIPYISLAQPPCGTPPCGGGNGGGGGGKPCPMPPCVPIDQGIEVLLIVGIIYGSRKIYLIKKE